MRKYHVRERNKQLRVAAMQGLRWGTGEKAEQSGRQGSIAEAF